MLCNSQVESSRAASVHSEKSAHSELSVHSQGSSIHADDVAGGSSADYAVSSGANWPQDDFSAGMTTEKFCIL